MIDYRESVRAVADIAMDAAREQVNPDHLSTMPDIYRVTIVSSADE
ncbi:MAG: hypothetical protein ABI771_15110 [Betaproteobacteria bacterium]